jgi:uncharacterized protein YprB with RNaseH-like and TPR domain
MKQRGPRIAFIDIETAPILMTAWGLFEQNAVWVERDTFLLSFAVQWSDQKNVKTYALPDYPGYKRNKHNDKHLVRDLWKVLNAADLICAHNGDAFDIKKINSRLAVHGFTPPAPYKTIDTLKMARRQFKFDSNKLDNLARYFSIGRKLPNTGAVLWRGCVEGDPKSWRTMRRYNAHDVRLLRGVYEKLKCWSPTHPDLRLYAGGAGCPTCQSNNIQRRGVSVAKARRYQRFQCLDCGSWHSGQSVTDDKPKRRNLPSH